MLGGAVAGLPTSAAAAASAAAVAVAAHKQFHPNSPPLDLDSWKEAFLQQANNNTNGNPNKNVRLHYAQNALQREWGNFPFANWNGIC